MTAGHLTGRVVILTGAAGGLGRAYAHVLAREGALLVLADQAARGSDPLEELAADIAKSGGQAATYRGDVADEGSADAVVKLALDRYGQVDALINNAGNWHAAPIAQTAADAWDTVALVHLRGHFLHLRAVARHWIAQHELGEKVDASVVNTTSRSALNAIEGHAAYAATKAGIVSLTQIAAKELQEYGIRVNCVAPAARTQMTLGIPNLAESMRSDSGFDEWDPANVAPLLAYLVSRDCALTGQVLFCRGGTIQPYAAWTPGAAVEKGRRWTIEEIAAELPQHLDPERDRS